LLVTTTATTATTTITGAAVAAKYEKFHFHVTQLNFHSSFLLFFAAFFVQVTDDVGSDCAAILYLCHVCVSVCVCVCVWEYVLYFRFFQLN